MFNIMDHTGDGLSSDSTSHVGDDMEYCKSESNGSVSS